MLAFFYQFKISIMVIRKFWKNILLGTLDLNIHKKLMCAFPELIFCYNEHLNCELCQSFPVAAHCDLCIVSEVFFLSSYLFYFLK